MIDTEPDAAIEPLLKPDEMLELIGCSYPTLSRLIKRGHIPPPLRLGGLRRWRRETIERWLERR